MSNGRNHKPDLDLTEALQLLHIEDGDTVRAIRTKYHQAVRRFHPDSAGANEEQALEMTKRLNIAFHLIMNYLQDRGKTVVVLSSPYSEKPKRHSTHAKGRHDFWEEASASSGFSASSSYESAFYESEKWPAATNPKAFCERTIYAVGDLFSSMGWFPEEDVNDPDDFYESDFMTRPRPVASGKYFWDPDYESFPMFVYSIHQKCKALMGTKIIDPMLLHQLMLEFIRPLECLRKIAEYSPTILALPSAFAFEGRISPGREGLWALRAFAHGTNPGDETLLLIPEIRQERIHVTLPDGQDLGHLSFEEDALYYICLMILRAGSTQMQITAATPMNNMEKSFRNLRLRITIAIPDSPEQIQDEPENHNLTIARLIQRSSH